MFDHTREGEMAASTQRRFGLGWVPDLPDHRDLMYSAPLQHLQQLPPSVDLRPQISFAPYDQGRIGSCTANAIAGAIQFDRIKTGKTPDFTPSRLFIYYDERVMEHSVPSDAGAQIRDGIKTVAKQGVCKETTWPYDDTPADPNTQLFPPNSPPATKPSANAYHEAEVYRAVSYLRVQQSLAQMRGCLAQGFPFVLGFTVYTCMWDASGNPVTVLPMPSGADSVAGGHAVLAVGYDDGKQWFIIRNSWGSNVQDHGYFYLPYAYATDPHLAQDFWTVRGMTN
jgi:C1A family cysteine protease